MSLPGPRPEPAPVRRRVRGTACRPRPRGGARRGRVRPRRSVSRQARQRDRDAGGRAAPHAGDDPSGQGAAFGGGGEGDRVWAQAQQCAGLGLPVGASDLGLRGVRGDGAATHRHQRRRPDHPGHRARQQVRATEERRSEAARWPLPQVLGGVHVHQSGVAHHRDPVGEREGLRLVVRDVQHRGVRHRGAQFLQFGEHALTQLRVQCCEGLVEQQHPGPDRQRAAIATRCCWPPDSSRGKRLPYADIPTIASASDTRPAISARGIRCARSPNATFSATRMCGNRA